MSSTQTVPYRMSSFQTVPCRMSSTQTVPPRERIRVWGSASQQLFDLQNLARSLAAVFELQNLAAVVLCCLPLGFAFFLGSGKKKKKSESVAESRCLGSRCCRWPSSRPWFLSWLIRRMWSTNSPLAKFVSSSSPLFCPPVDDRFLVRDSWICLIFLFGFLCVYFFSVYVFL